MDVPLCFFLFNGLCLPRPFSMHLQMCQYSMYNIEDVFSFCTRDHLMRVVLREHFFPYWLCLRFFYVTKGRSPSSSHFCRLCRSLFPTSWLILNFISLKFLPTQWAKRRRYVIIIDYISLIASEIEHLFIISSVTSVSSFYQFLKV